MLRTRFSWARVACDDVAYKWLGMDCIFGSRDSGKRAGYFEFQFPIALLEIGVMV